MRPIQLKIKGLHSFRELVTIDFDRLCRGGVFGIFGPTGSGKSTILDAMTLSLYGKVERAANHTHGILNQAENELYVSFTFELLKGKGARRFRVERSYKKAEEGRVRNATSRLMEMAASEVVLADRDREVTQQVENLLGLTADDFARAVVLPQGKFSEFLSLKGKERREMLERIFHLEEYGERLNERLKQKMEGVMMRLEAIAGEQQGLGDASEEALALAREKAARFEEEASLARKRRMEVEQKAAELEKVWNWQKELAQVEKEQADHRQQQGEMEKRTYALQKGEEAERLRPLLTNLIRSEEEVAAFRGLEEEGRRALAEEKVRFEELKARYEAARKEKEDKAPSLTVRLERLQEAEGQIQKAEGLDQELIALKNRWEELAKKEEQGKREHEALLNRIDRGRERQKHLKAELESCAVKAEERQVLREAQKRRQEILSLEEEERKRRAEFASRKKDEEEAERLREERERKFRIASERGREAFTAWLHHLDAAKNALEKGTSILQKIEQGIAMARLSQEEEQKRFLAAEWAQGLKEGDPCPVCGSTRHPHPALSHGSLLPRWQELIRRGEDLIGRGEEYRRKLRESLIRLEGLAFHFQKMLSSSLAGWEGEIAATDSSSAEDLLPSQREADFLSALESSASVSRPPFSGLEEAEKELHHLGERLQEEIESFALGERGREAGKETWQAAYSQLEAEQSELLRLLPLLEEKRREAKAAEGKVALIEADLEKKRRAYRDAFPHLPLERVEERERELEEREKKEEEVRKSIEKSLFYLEKWEEEKKEIEHRLNRLEKERREVEVTLQLKGKQREEERARLTMLLKDPLLAAHLPARPEGEFERVAVTKAIQQIRVSLVNLIRNEEESEKAYREGEERYRNLEENYTRITASLQHAEKEKNHHLGEWAKRLAASSFRDREEVQSWLHPAETLEGWRRRLEEYRDKGKELEREFLRLNTLLQGRGLTEEEWQALIIEKEEAIQADEKALELRAKAKRDVEELEIKAVRWKQLENNRRFWSKEKELLQRLQSVLKGNAFVEFIAEEHLHRISRDASARLLFLTRNRYALEVDSGGGFVIRDDANGGMRRPVSTLSGGETFLTSLALALSLSAQIQLKGEYPLQFFFLDEGFGTLDAELLDTALTALERLHENHLSIGIISHVPELKERIPRQLIVEPAEPSGRGTRVRIETM
ncbi:putative Nuclease SbcCD subunit C [[Clostridium] ultunense Esp]|nr:putative Nuclease SbcCD subunit C [[Clostridium] ultunense Esp]